MEGRFWKSISIGVWNKCPLENSHGLFNNNGDQLILGDELESLMKGR